MVYNRRLVINPNFSSPPWRFDLASARNSLFHDVGDVVRHERTVLLHDGKELDDDLGGRADQDLTATALLGVVDGVKRIVEDGSLDHFDGVESRFSNRGIEGYEVSKIYDAQSSHHR